jgi:hypothetical protein
VTRPRTQQSPENHLRPVEAHTLLERIRSLGKRAGE